MLLIILGVLTALVFLLWIYSSPFHWKRKGVPYLLPLPIFGSNLPSFRMSLTDFYDYLYSQFPDEKYFGFHYFMKPTLFIKDPALMKDICIKDFEHFTRNGFYSNEDDPLGENLLFIYGQAWKEMHEKISPLFTPAKLRCIQGYVENSMVKVHKCIKDKIAANEPVKIERLTIGIATNVIVQAIFGIETDCFEENSKFVDVGNKMFCTKTNLKLVLSMIAPDLNDFFKLHTFGEDVNNFLRNILKNVIKYRESNPVKNQDFVNVMMNMMKTAKERNGKQYFPDKTKMPNNDFNTALAQALILYAGGAESAAMTMAFFLYEAALNQEIQDKCRDEIMAVVNETGTDIRPEDINELTYLDMALKETMRKYPPFALIARKCTKTYKFRDSDLTIEPGTLLIAPTKSTQWDPKNFPNPEAFIPERFADKSTVDSGAYIVWGLGPRICIGKNFAKMEMVLAISRLLRNYKFTISSKMEVPVKQCRYTAVITPNPGIFLDVEPIGA
ncbi:hypothetical protein O3M35_007215 [Rhynocoris fuscipes]|uniref:Cytochrome P450 n=1 Tax=Rhynocoris fuscipes TaxID=488301 RepID=A0AAW1D8K5_9HEMI